VLKVLKIFEMSILGDHDSVTSPLKYGPEMKHIRKHHFRVKIIKRRKK